MSLLRTIESRIARLVEGSFGRVFRSKVQPVELARRLVKEMDEHQQRTVRNVYVPNRYDVYLSRDDHRQLTQYAAALTSELSEYLAEHARRNNYALLTRPRVEIHLDRDLSLGAFGIAVQMEQKDAVEQAVEAIDEDPRIPSPEAAVAAANTLVSPAIDADSDDLDASHSDFVLFGGADGPRHMVDKRYTVGRGRANDIVLQDNSVSREHGEFIYTSSGWEVCDRGSTNGVSVNGVKVEREPLRAGDVIAFGTKELRFDRFDEDV